MTVVIDDRARRSDAVNGRCAEGQEHATNNIRTMYTLGELHATLTHALFKFKISSTRLTLPSLPVPGAISRSTRVPMRMSVAMRGAPFACTAA